MATAYTRKNKSNDLEPNFPTSDTKSRCLENTKTAVALPHCSESTKESIVGWWTSGLDVRLELGRTYETSYAKTMEVEGASSRILVRRIGLFIYFCGRCNTDNAFSFVFNGRHETSPLEDRIFRHTKARNIWLAICAGLVGTKTMCRMLVFMYWSRLAFRPPGSILVLYIGPGWPFGRPGVCWKTPSTHAAEPRDCPCRPRSPQS